MVRCKYLCWLLFVLKCLSYIGEYGNLCYLKYIYVMVYGGRYFIKCKFECSCLFFLKCFVYFFVYVNYG